MTPHRWSVPNPETGDLLDRYCVICEAHMSMAGPACAGKQPAPIPNASRPETGPMPRPESYSVHDICMEATPDWFSRIQDDFPSWSPIIGVNHMAVEYQILCKDESREIHFSASFLWEGLRGRLPDDRIAELARQCADKLYLTAQREEGLSAWQPIATAPKDGTEVLLKVRSRAGASRKCLVGHYMRGGLCIEDHPPIQEGWYFWNGFMFDVAAEPLEWQPLPQAPEGE